MGVGAKGLGIVTVFAIGLVPVAAQVDDAPPVRRVDEVRLPGLAIGRSYSTWQLAESPLVVHNPSDDTLRIRVEIVLPARHELRPGARPVPDRAWVTLESRQLIVPPHGEHRTDVQLTLPYEPDLAGHTYQVDLTCVERRAGTWFVRERRRLLFAVEMDYRDDTEVDLASRGPVLGARM
jgi:hypothetical protein